MSPLPAIPSGPYISPPPVSVTPGDLLNLSCSTHGALPAPSITW